MKNHVALALGTIAAIAVPSCTTLVSCPSLFLTVEKASRSPRPPLAPPSINPNGIPMPADLSNRFLANGNPDAKDIGVGFTDDPRVIDAGQSDAGQSDAGQHLDAREASFIALARIQEAYGGRTDVVPPGAFDVFGPDVRATMTCADEPQIGCRLITAHTLDLPKHLRYVRITFDSDPRIFYAGVRNCYAHLDKPLPHPPTCAELARSEVQGPVDLDLELGHSLADSLPGSAHVRFAAELPSISQTMLSFIHISDIQIRDTDVRVGGRHLSKQLDKLIPSFEYDEDQQFNNRYMVESLFETINAEVAHTRGKPEQPMFAIHTGDAIDSGVTTELRDVHALVDRLSLPFFDALGNHDVLVFGNMMPTGGSNPYDDTDCATVESIASAEFRGASKVPWLLPNKLCIAKHVRCKDCSLDEIELVAASGDDRGPNEGTHLHARRQFIAGWHHDLADPRVQLGDWPLKSTIASQAGCRASEAPWRAGPLWTNNHGFDLAPGGAQTPGDRGYYTFAVEMPVVGGEVAPRHAIFIAVDTNEYEEHKSGAAGFMSKNQIDWLRSQLQCAGTNDLVFVYGHHPISRVGVPGETESFEAVLNWASDHNHNIVAYLFGHEHQNEICRDTRKGTCTKFWEVQTGSLIEFPQEARRIRIKYAGRGLAYLELVNFTERSSNTGDDRARAIALARAGAERDHCASEPEAVCTPDGQRVFRRDGRDTNSRLWFSLPGYPRH